MELIWLELVLGFGVPVAWGVRELLILRRERNHEQAAATLLREATTDHAVDDHEHPERSTGGQDRR